MSSSSRSRMNRRYWMKNGLYSKFLVGLCCLAVISMIIFSAIAIYEFRVAGVERCQVHSTDVIKRKNLFYPRWTIQIQYEERTIVEHMIGSIGQSTASRAWRIVEQYKINQTYACYRSSNQDSDDQWIWKSNKLSKLKSVALILGAIFVSLIIVLQLFVVCQSSDDDDIPEPLNSPNEQVLPYTDEEPYQPTTPPESPPPSYEQATKQIGGI